MGAWALRDTREMACVKAITTLILYRVVIVRATIVQTKELWYTYSMENRLDRKQLRAWRVFITAHATMIDLIERELAEAGELPLSSYDVLLALVEAPSRRLRMHELAQAVVLSRSGLTRLVDRLEQDDLLRRDRSGSDRRATYAVLTLKGLRAFRRAWPIYQRGIVKHFVEYLSEEELRVLTGALERVLGGANEKPSAKGEE